MAEIKNGGPAFPGGMVLDRDYAMQCDGMSLRDWFAGQALAGIVGCPRDFKGVNNRKDVAKLAYDFADDMLAARGGSNG